MPGGIGTLEELFEVFTWAQLGFHEKPIGLLNTHGFYDGLIGFLKHLVDERFLKAAQASLLMHEADASILLSRFKSYKPDYHSKVLARAAAETLVP
jgi:uncharacterized protein (TIGR00730 family)